MHKYVTSWNEEQDQNIAEQTDYKRFKQEAEMDAGDRAAVEAACKNGVGVLHNLLLQDELDAIRRELSQAYLDLNMGPGRTR